MKIQQHDIDEAYKLVSSILEPTPLVKNIRLSSKYNCNIFLKLENMSPVGSFKLRGALYKISNLTPQEKKRGVLAVSAGNHAQGVAWAASKFKTKSTIIMPETTPLIKIKNTTSFGAKVILKGENVEESFKFAQEYNNIHKHVFVHPFEDPHVIAGQSTIATELLEQLDQIDFVFGSIGGGGLMTGIGHVMKKRSPKTKIVGAQATGASSMIKSLREHKVVHSKYSSTFADGVKVKRTSRSMYSHLKELVDIPVAVEDSQIAMSLLELLENAHVLAEGAGALPLAAFETLFNKTPKKFAAKNVVLIICGGNIDVNLLGRIIDKGLIYSGRRVRLKVKLHDRPGELSHITDLLYHEGANILQVIHDDESPHIGLFQTSVQVTIETKGKTHLEKTLKKLRMTYPKIEILD
jgi:threonine dehydratase